MKELNNTQLSKINGGKSKGGGFLGGYLGGKLLDYIIEGTLNPSEHSKSIAKRAYGSKWKIKV